MTWHFTEDTAAFRAAAGEHLAAEPARNTAVLTLMDRADRLGWWAEPDGRVTGVLAVSPSGVLDLGATTEEAALALACRAGEEPVLALRAGQEPTEVRGETGTVEAYAEASGRPWAPVVRMRLFRLGEPTPPDPAPAGRHRIATEADVPLVAAWTREFAEAIGDEPADDYTGFVTERISEGRLILWDTPGGRAVSMAAVSRTIEGQARVHLVYTPRAERGHGYAAGATEAVGRLAADALGAAQVLLFTDLSNPTSNALYQRLGYRPVADHLGVAFNGPAR
ncbi:GNAT family N-acetyltransferase [Streptomyces sp. NBC_00572]|uniref:GNAT family N-acetyltransferase n=1 Tax=Streptomyces sp. NBC_00572 TaxID=2903664 RepID=UPI002257E1CC|nr:GNAT family N-acetyltransferase [Streptomyces sp. NBC_00572]MCX4980578.1 GNAT family N-acetyltransferase [Streptomyces sp. NBC_00572]